MSNVISARRDAGPQPTDLHLSNGETDTLMLMLVLAGSRLASDDGERILVIFLAAREQRFRGGGMAGFALDEMPWSRDRFDAQRAFLAQVIDAALAKTRWAEVKDFTPRLDLYGDALRQLHQMLAELTLADIPLPPDPEELDPEAEDALWEPPDAIEFCPLHRVVMYEFGVTHCNVCHWEQKAPLCCEALRHLTKR